jgi:hypothetical protein
MKKETVELEFIKAEEADLIGNIYENYDFYIAGPVILQQKMDRKTQEAAEEAALVKMI